jgi:hypothetical protein
LVWVFGAATFTVVTVDRLAVVLDVDPALAVVEVAPPGAAVVDVADSPARVVLVSAVDVLVVA